MTQPKNRKVLVHVQNTKEERSAKETLARLKLLGIKIGIAALVLILVATFSGISASKRVDKRYQTTVQEYEDQIKSLEDEHNQMVRTYTNVSTEVDLNLLNMKISEVAELATVEYRYTDAGRFSDGRDFLGFEIPWLKKSFTAKWEGIIKAGIDMNQVTFTADESSHTLTIALPPARILSHEILNDSIETLDETKNIFNPISVTDVRKFDAASKTEMEKRAEESGLLAQARENAENVISRLFYQTPSIYTIQFVDLT